MTSEKPRPTESQWLEHKTFIGQEYLAKDTSLKHLMDALAARGLHATKAQLEYKLKKWQFSKNLDRQSWQYIERKINTRKSQGKQSEVIHYGRRLDRLKVAKEMRRHSETNIFKQLAAQTDAPSPVNSQLIVCTPPSYETIMEWPESLPWLRFLNRHWNSAQLLFQPSTLTIARAQHFGLLLQILDRSGSVPIFGASNGTSKLESLLSNTMPEFYPGEHARTAQSLIAGPIDESGLDLFKILVYKISSGARLSNYPDWEMISTILRTSLRGLPQNLKTLPTDSVVFQAFLDSTFQHEIHHRTGRNPNAPFWPLDLIRRILELGHDPNCPLDQQFGFYRTPIENAINAGDLELAQLLFHFHARVDDSQLKSDGDTIIGIALRSSNSNAVKVRTLKFLLQYDNSLDVEEVLSAAICLRDMALVQAMLYQDVDVAKQVVPAQDYSRYGDFNLEHYLDFKSLLTTAAQACDDILILMLDYLELSDRLFSSVTVDLLIATAFGGSVEIMRRLLNIRPLSTASNLQGSTPLQAAVAGGNIPVCQMLLEIDKRLPPDLVYLAASFGHEDVLLMLCRSGLHDPGWHSYDFFIGFMRDRCCYSCVIRRETDRNSRNLYGSLVNCLTILIEQGARMEEGEIAELAYYCMEKPLKAALASDGNPDDQDYQGLTALQCALQPTYLDGKKDDKSALIVEILLQAKAKLRGGEVVAAIQNENKACISLLCDYGATLGDCDSTGKTCLEAAILAQNTELIPDILEELDPSIDLRPICAALQMEDRSLVEQLLRHDLKEECFSMQATAIGLAATSGYFDILDELQSRFSPFGLPTHKAFLPYKSTKSGIIQALERNPNCEISSTSLQNLIIEYPCKTCRFTPCLKASPLALAACGENVSGFRKLLEKGYRADFTTLAVLMDLQKGEISAEFVELLKIYQPRLEHLLPFTEIETPLTTAMEYKDITLFKYLVEGGMDVNANNKTLVNGFSPLQMAVWKGHLDVVHYLLGKGATVNAPPALNDGTTALQAAVIGRHTRLANILIERGVRIDARGARINGRTALEAAAGRGNVDMLQLLLHHGAITNGPGRRQFVVAVGIAMDHAHNAAVKFLKRERGWTKTDDGLLQQYKDHRSVGSYNWGEGCMACRTYCCDEIHDNDASCIYDYSAKEEETFADVCGVCNKWKWGDCSEPDDEEYNEAIPCRHEAVN